MSFALITIGSNKVGLVLKLMRSSLHLGSLSSYLFTEARVEKVSTAFWMLLSLHLLTVFETVYHQRTSTDLIRGCQGR